MLLVHKKYALYNGFLLGLILCILTLFFYFLYPKILFETTSYSTIFIFIFLLFPILMIFKNFDIIYTFKEYFSIVFVVLSVSSLIYSFFIILLYNILENNVVGIYGLLPSVFFDLKLDDDSNYFIHSFTILSQLNSYVFWLMPCILYSALISLFKKIIQ